jgi:hypothetical protein
LGADRQVKTQKVESFNHFLVYKIKPFEKKSTAKARNSTFAKELFCTTRQQNCIFVELKTALNANWQGK